MKVYLFILKRIPGHRNYAIIVKSIPSCLTKAGGGGFMGSLICLLAFLNKVSFRCGFIATGKERQNRTSEVSLVLC